MLTQDYSIFNNKTAVCGWCQGSVQGIGLGTCSRYLGMQAVQMELRPAQHANQSGEDSQGENRESQAVLRLLGDLRILIKNTNEEPGESWPGPAESAVCSEALVFL